jgi:hypothetical protein
MKKFLVAAAALTLMCGSAFAQTSTGQAAPHHSMTKPSMTHGSTHKGSMSRGTVGMSRGTKTNRMNPDASGQGGSGPGSDQGGSRVSPNNMK